MWIAEKLRYATREYSFEDSGQGRLSDLALIADDTQIANMLRAVEWDDDPVQVEVCEHCGVPRCQSGGFVSFRKLGDFVAGVPSLAAYASDAGDWERTEYSAPLYIAKRGALLIRNDDWMRLETELGLPPPKDFAHLSWAEALVAAQFDAEEGVFSKPGSPFESQFRRRLLATDPFLSPDDIEALLAPQHWAAPDAHARLVDASKAVPITLVLDDPFVQATPFARVSGAFGLRFAPGIVIAPT